MSLKNPTGVIVLLTVVNVAGAGSVILSPVPGYVANDVLTDAYFAGYDVSAGQLVGWAQTSLNVYNIDTAASSSLGAPTDGYSDYWNSFVTVEPAGQSAWVGFTTDGNVDDRIYQVDPNSGSVLRQFVAPDDDARGITWDGRTLWISDRASDVIYQVSPDTGTVHRAFSAPEADPRDLAWDGRTLWLVGNQHNRVYQLDPTTGTAITSFAVPSADPEGLTWDGRALWHGDRIVPAIYQISVN